MTYQNVGEDNNTSNVKPVNKLTTRTSNLEIWQEIIALTRRLYIQAKRKPSILIAGLIQPLLWLILFGALFQNIPINLRESNIQYGLFFSPGIIIFTAFNGSINAGLPLMFDREFGFLNRLLTCPLISKNSLLIASLYYIVTITIMQTSLIVIFNKIMFNNISNIKQIIFIISVTGMISISIASISIALAFILPGHIEFLAMILLINLPTLFSSTALAPLSFMPYWLQVIACINPITYAIEILREICINDLLIYQTSLIKTVWLNLNLENSLYILIIFNLISIVLARVIIKYKCE
uniref:ABC transmembrane type-2 domain-containing protein n=1 Tax=Spyridia filamentosa TaxID=196632 RepID=A0A1Z1MJQ2_SPYFI|nr:hypothetical protein [Spyridia filamentosa]ARW66278.1 hypothetical protein [Spyridia filamentosa]